MSLVLIVDDNFDNRSIYRSLLSYLGYEVAEATDGNEAIEMATSLHPDVILMDMSLPVRDGWSATRELKNDSSTAEIPIIAFSAHASTEHRARAEAAGCDAYVAKPVVPSEVAETIRRFTEP